VTVTVVVQATGANGYTNTVTLTPLVGVTNLGSSTATAPGTATVQITPSLTKAVASSTIAVGGTTSFTIVIGNTGPSTMTTASIVDTLPSNLTATQVSSDTGGGATVPTAFNLSGTTVRGSVTIPTGGTVTVTVVVQATGANGYTNTVTLTPLVGVTNLGSSTATAPGTATVQITPSLTKAVASSTIAVGGTTSFTIVIGNTGPSTMTTASIVDTLPSNLTATQVSSDTGGGATVPTAFNLSGTTVRGSVTIPTGGTVTVTVVVQATGANGYTNTVTLTPLVGVTNLGSSTATAPGTATVQITPSLTKAVASSTIAVGGTTSFTIVIGNTGPSTMTTASIVDTLPSNLTATQVSSDTGGGATVPTAFNLSGTTVRGSVTIPTGGTVTVTVVVQATGANGYTNTVTLTPLVGGDEPGQQHGDGAGHHHQRC
jgi:uncharacterized repeat protein (TIGR01451 family)